MKKKQTYYHYTESYLLSPTHPVTINLIGCGGTGSQVLNNLGRIHATLQALGHPGFMVCAWDPDIVTEANLGRQLFTPGDVGIKKTTVLISRINRFYGTAWRDFPEEYNTMVGGNIIITCVDNVKTRRKIYENLKGQWQNTTNMEHLRYYYWMDFGNNATKGQVIMGSRQVKQPAKTPYSIKQLPNVFNVFPDMEKHEVKDTGPSCSVAEAINKQDLFINSTLAQHGCHMLWKMFREARLAYHGIFLNMETMNINTLKVKSTNN